ncbi:MAG: TIR domain-containing protein [Ruminococcaceae bacterium]|nr:TIR domain-containing protein [Oscillospiraceae bacterium]
MAILKCKMCGGDLNVNEGATTAECEYCGSLQTIPTVDNEKKISLFQRANKLRSACEFDKAAGVFESIVAEFPEEAEAYWGLVLCKYGIEYVDDPATGKKIPTCHRSSFDSVMDDNNFDLAMENADAVARKVYRNEAKYIEEIRKGIISVSESEAPYDIFICYKETDENNERTIDSVFAQEIYNSLIEKGYKVFFARITLEDKLGLEYEPYIFAALNSAKVMIVVGTDYEYFNAVWVKNEWSRYLSLMSVDKTKHIIPCYKDVDAYDIPKEFNRFQAIDMNKIGFMQDLARGIEKLISVKQEVPNKEISEPVADSSKAVSLLGRGKIALEDRDWQNADKFFEEVLNINYKNADAYLGKVLATEKCSDLSEFVNKRKNSYSDDKFDEYELEQDVDYINKQIENYAIEGYFSRSEISSFYVERVKYLSSVKNCEKYLLDESDYWKNHKVLARVYQFASNELLATLNCAKEEVFEYLRELITKARNSETINIKNAKDKYLQLIKNADISVELRYKQISDNREMTYQRLVEQYNTAKSKIEYTELIEWFKRLNGYKESNEYIDSCKKQIDKYEQARIIENKKGAWRLSGLCQHCGSKFTGLLVKKCVKCGKQKDY